MSISQGQGLDETVRGETENVIRQCVQLVQLCGDGSGGGLERVFPGWGRGSSLEKGPSSEEGSPLITAAVLAFPKEFWTTMFPLEALFEQFEPVGTACILISWHIDSVQQ